MLTRRERQRSLHEARHKLDVEKSRPVRDDVSERRGQRRVLYEAAHKLDSYQRPSEAQTLGPRVFETEGDVVAHAGLAVMVLGALGVVYGDLGTSPLYTEQVVFHSYRATAHITPAAVYGVASMIFWALMIIITFKYAGFIMRAHNRGDGGNMALGALLQRSGIPKGAALATLAIFGAGLFWGDGMVTPAITVLGAVQGIQVATPALTHVVVPLSAAILVGLFVLQRFGTGRIGWLFGPVVIVWFVAIATVGLTQIVKDPGVFQGLSPVWAVRFFLRHGAAAYLTLGGIVLTVTGGEALYADRGHFGAKAIRIGFLGIALPGVMLNYLGQAVWILHHPAAAHAADFNPFFQVAAGWALWPMVMLATAASIIAAQAAIAGSFSIARQAVQLGFLPRIRVLHTSRLEGQIYVPLMNWALCTGVIVLTLVFRSSTRLSDVYGVAVTGTFILDTIMFLLVARLLWRTSRWKLAPVGALLLTVEVAFFSANVAKVAQGAWLPLAVAALASGVMITWRRGYSIVTRNRAEQEGPLSEFLDELAAMQPPLRRVPSTAIFLNPSKHTTPLALRATVKHTHTLQEKVVIVSVEVVGVPHVDREDRFVVSPVGHAMFRVVHVADRIGYRDTPDVPKALTLARKLGLLERNLDLEHASYFVSHMTITPTSSSGLRMWRKRLYIAMARNAASPSERFGLPIDRTVTIGSHVVL